MPLGCVCIVTLTKPENSENDVPPTFVCDLCDGSFWYSSLLELHKKDCHTEKPYQCLTCHVSFSKKSFKNAHDKSGIYCITMNCCISKIQFLHDVLIN